MGQRASFVSASVCANVSLASKVKLLSVSDDSLMANEFSNIMQDEFCRCDVKAFFPLLRNILCVVKYTF